MSRRSFLIIANPISGTDDKRRMAATAAKSFIEAGIDTHIMFTQGVGDARRFAEEAALRGLDGVIAMGGDGTVNEVASGLINSQTTLGIIPMGSGNGLARHLGIPLNPAEATYLILRQKTICCDYASANGRPFFCTFGVGFDARVSHRFASLKRRGKFGYLRSIIDCSRSYQPATYTVEYDGGAFTRKAFVIAVCNSSQYGNNAFIAPHASLTDGMLDMTVVNPINPINPIDYVRNSFELFTGLISNNGRFETLRSRRFAILSPGNLEVHLDGEPLLFRDSIEITCHPAALNVFCPEEPKFKPIITPINGTIQEIHSAITKPLI